MSNSRSLSPLAPERSPTKSIKQDLNEMKNLFDPKFTPMHSTSNSEICMQEIISPFRNARNSIHLIISPEGSDDGWKINPQMISRSDEITPNFEHQVPVEAFQVSPECSPCQSPVKGAGNTYDISPGKLLETAISKQQAMLKDIELKMREIEANSPSKGSFIDRESINALKSRRLLQLSENERTQISEKADIMDKLVRGIRTSMKRQ